MKNSSLKNTLILTIITLVAGLALGFVYEITKAPIEAVNQEAKIAAWAAVFPDEDTSSFEAVDVNTEAAEKALAEKGIEGSIEEVAKVGETGYVVTAIDSKGYGGDIKITVGINNDGTINGVSILTINETAGLGMRAKTDPTFKEQYVGKAAEQFYVSKDGGEGEPIEALSGATVTSRAFTGAVNAALLYYQTELGN